MKKITIVGSGYVGMSLSAMLCQNNDVLAFDVNKERVNLINNKESTVEDGDINEFLKKNSKNISATDDASEAFKSPDLVIIIF